MSTSAKPTATQAASNPASVNPLSSEQLADLRQVVNTRLQRSLDVEALLESLLSSVRMYLPINGIEFVNEDLHLNLLAGVRSTHSCDYKLSLADDYIGNITFRSKLRFSEEELVSIEQLMGSVIWPLRNAILFARSKQAPTKAPAANPFEQNDEAMRRDFARARHFNRALTTLIARVDQINDIASQYGVDQATRVQGEISDIITDKCRKSDSVYCANGRDIVIIMNNTRAEEANWVAERICKALSDTYITVAGQQLKASVSIGVASMRRGETLETLLERAEQRLSNKQHNQCNRVVGIPSHYRVSGSSR